MNIYSQHAALIENDDEEFSEELPQAIVDVLEKWENDVVDDIQYSVSRCGGFE